LFAFVPVSGCPAEQGVLKTGRLGAQSRDNGGNRGLPKGLGAQDHPIGKLLMKVLGQQPHEVGVPVRHETREESDAGPGAGRLDVHKNVR
jgi:hypothetical protein